MNDSWMAQKARRYYEGVRVSDGTYCSHSSFAEIARQVLTAVDIPLDTPPSQLDDFVRTGRIYCSCGDPDMPLPNELGWITFVSLYTRLPTPT